MDKIQSLIINAINDKLPVGLANPILLIMTLIGQIISRINVYLSRITRKPTNLTQTKFQYLLEKPNNFKFDSSYLNSVTDSSSPLIKCLDDYCNAHQVYSKGAIVSLSGGVDSMVTLAILIHLQKTHNFPIYTASIDYGLRKESADESEFLIAYTKMFGIKSYVSYVEGISRKKEDSGSRSEFEEESRNLRFNTYKKIIEENGLDSDCGVFVGHHQDDIIENIFTNSMKGGNLLDLPVMKSESKIHGINIYRPFLAYRKDQIYKFAHEFNVPYFLDTTPKWSRRGKMRNEIFPLLDSVFGLDWHNKLKHLGDQSIEWGEYIGTYVVDPWMSEVVIGSRGIIIPIKPQPKLIYSHVILKALHKSGESMIRKTSMEKIMIMLNTVETNRVVTLDGTRMATLIKNNSYLMIFNKRFTKSESVDTQDIFNKFINGVVDITDSTQQKDLPIHLHKYIGSCW
jgi:tRNA(Ile)-lysidine synthetase-like protein